MPLEMPRSKPCRSVTVVFRNFLRLHLLAWRTACRASICLRTTSLWSPSSCSTSWILWGSWTFGKIRWAQIIFLTVGFLKYKFQLFCECYSCWPPFNVAQILLFQVDVNQLTSTTPSEYATTAFNNFQYKLFYLDISSASSIEMSLQDFRRLVRFIYIYSLSVS